MHEMERIQLVCQSPDEFLGLGGSVVVSAGNPVCLIQKSLRHRREEITSCYYLPLQLKLNPEMAFVSENRFPGLTKFREGGICLHSYEEMQWFLRDAHSIVECSFSYCVAEILSKTLCINVALKMLLFFGGV